MQQQPEWRGSAGLCQSTVRCKSGGAQSSPANRHPQVCCSPYPNHAIVMLITDMVALMTTLAMMSHTVSSQIQIENAAW